MPRKKPSEKSPKVHTALIGDPVTMWEKLCWDVDQFQDIQRSYPRETQPLAFAAINVCIAAWSLEKWALTAWKQRRDNTGKRPDEREFYELIRRHVPTQAVCSAVANTAKHASHREDEGWEGGEVRFEWKDGNDDVPSTYVLKYTDPRKGDIVAYGAFEAARDQWWDCLLALGLTDRPQYSPEFFQNKLGRIFGGVPRIPPPSMTNEGSHGNVVEANEYTSRPVILSEPPK